MGLQKKISKQTSRDIFCDGAIAGGNWNNSSNAGPFYVNLNNAPSNANANIGADLSYR